MTNLKDVVILIFLIFIAVLLYSGLIYALNNIHGKFNYITHIKSSSCDNSSLEDTLECLNHDFNSWYKFNLTNKGKEMSEDYFIGNGGVCIHAALWYKNKLDSKGFSSEMITMIPQNDSGYGHAFLVTWDYNLNTYCIVDQWEYSCRNLL